MINDLFILRSDTNGSVAEATHIVRNNRELLKQHGMIHEVIGRYLQNLSSMNDEVSVEIRITGPADALQQLKEIEGIPGNQNSFYVKTPVLTPHGQNILNLLNEGKNCKQIAGIFSVSHQTMRNQCCLMHKIFHCKTNGEMLHAAKRLGFIN